MTVIASARGEARASKMAGQRERAPHHPLHRALAVRLTVDHVVVGPTLCGRLADLSHLSSKEASLEVALTF